MAKNFEEEIGVFDHMSQGDSLALQELTVQLTYGKTDIYRYDDLHGKATLEAMGLDRFSIRDGSVQEPPPEESTTPGHDRQAGADAPPAKADIQKMMGEAMRRIADPDVTRNLREFLKDVPEGQLQKPAPSEMLFQSGYRGEAPKVETPEQKESRELAEKNVTPALQALKDWNIEKLCDIAAKMKDNPEALRQLEKTLTQKLGIGIFFNKEGVALWKNDVDGLNSVTSTVMYKANGQPSEAFQSFSDNQPNLGKAITVKEANAIISSEVAKAFKSKT